MSIPRPNEMPLEHVEVDEFKSVDLKGVADAVAKEQNSKLPAQM